MALGKGTRSNGMSRKNTMQGFTLTTTNDAKKTKLRGNFDVKINKVSGP